MSTIWRDFVTAQFQQSMDVPQQFFALHADAISQASHAMAQRFHRGGRLLVFGNGGSATDAQHVAVEFVHPVIVGKRALPAIALTNDIAATLGLAQQVGLGEIFARQLHLLGKPDDIALGLSVIDDESVTRGLAIAREMGMLTIGFSGPASTCSADFKFEVPSPNPRVVQETQETAYHILWETVHVFFEHPGLLT